MHTKLSVYEVIFSNDSYAVYYGSIRIAVCRDVNAANRIAELLNEYGFGGISQRVNSLTKREV